jgi:hydroxyacylglutathione hydrolase
MIFKQYYLGCLSHASYLIGDESTGRAVVVDPQRDVSEYIADAEAHGLTIERVIETHFHADFLSGHLELADRTGAVITFGEAAAGKAGYPIDAVAHGTRLSLGEVMLEVRATPGHTPESISVVVWEREGDAAPYGVLTGDTLFIGDVGRPDLLASFGVTADELAAMLYDSLHDQLLTLPDETKVFPAHGAGSACGKNLSTETVSTIGDQRRSNYALAPMTKEQFKAVVTEGQPAAPLYFAFDATMNKQDRPLLDETEAPRPLTIDEVLDLQRDGAVVVDTREGTDFAAGHLRGSVNVGLSGRFAEYTGDVVRHDETIVLVSDPGTELEAKIRLGRIGFDRVAGVLAEPQQAFLSRPDVVEQSSRLTINELEERREHVASLQIVDVRNPGEVRLGAIPGSWNIPLPQLLDRLGELDPERPTVVNCAGGYRSLIGASVLRSKGFADVSDVLGGFDAWLLGGHPVERGLQETT